MASADLGRRYEDVISNKPRVNVVTVAILVAALGLGAVAFRATGNPAALAGFVLLGLVAKPAPRIARQWERGAVLRFLVLGHPVIVELAAAGSPLEGEAAQAFDAAFIEAVQLYAKHIERDVEMFVMLEAHFSLEALRTDALGRARLFAAAV